MPIDPNDLKATLPPLRQLFPEHLKTEDLTYYGAQPPSGNYPVAHHHASQQRYSTPAPVKGVSGHHASYPASHAPGLPQLPPTDSKYDCPYCGKRFDRPSSVKIHITSHTGEKPYVCVFPGCGRRFSVNSNMRRHLRTHNTPSSLSQSPQDIYEADEDEIPTRHAAYHHHSSSHAGHSHLSHAPQVSIQTAPYSYQSSQPSVPRSAIPSAVSSSQYPYSYAYPGYPPAQARPQTAQRWTGTGVPAPGSGNSLSSRHV